MSLQAASAGASELTAIASEVEIRATAQEAWTAARAVADEWGAQWGSNGEGSVEGSSEEESAAQRVTLLTVAGLRRGEVTGRVEVEPSRSGAHPGNAAKGVRLRFTKEAESLRVQPIPALFLAFAAFGCLVVLAWPFLPALAPLVPFSILLALGAWFLVVAKLSNTGPPEFLEAVRERAESTPR